MSNVVAFPSNIRKQSPVKAGQRAIILVLPVIPIEHDLSQPTWTPIADRQPRGSAWLLSDE